MPKYYPGNMPKYYSTKYTTETHTKYNNVYLSDTYMYMS